MRRGEAALQEAADLHRQVQALKLNKTSLVWDRCRKSENP